jgi:hypothetical protein
VEGDETLLAVPPGSRNAPRLRLSPSKKKKKGSSRDRRESDGPRKRSHAASWGQQSTGTDRGIFPGLRDGIGSLGHGIVGVSESIYENDQSTYNIREQTEEDKLFQLNDSIRILLKGLESIETTEEVLTEQQDEN